ncbi:MAG: D-glycero-beta-D-manno-heptose 1-phosphate adenylyltransferase [candidate division KSB1 bacterium]|nr:D-glycero-beta-D-manno-heptose 1-phosphate adenylyltransferase [candidate division KSB1 bacterium]MDZ7275785.1 D-glycero-beta-D-manno-heptose 1-phosphate adenylyltransferase [candidate division KSB1 bacterium]MDZ7287537.1 D-glycero-beta-D-manno-heptose 1-phosphate adenylyltransferase [candidate division KSB1 bacterium]MDZ7307963.1 D-glycero-beta-D-manno-heptose 1-phosphate adenylyltransferase [candidate division KSB1 bacterium]MDZ7350515.1 D-glycero-beta-D-manno-heptose 1-phosphate adenylylt
MGRLIALEELLELRAAWRRDGKRMVFTNGCFDLLHRGHVEYLQQAARLGDFLVVGLNSDESVRRLKGEGRPIVPQEDRATILAALACVDYVVYFEQDTPAELIHRLRPEVLVKGADYQIHEIVGHELVQAAGGQVVRIALTPGRATRDVLATILERFCHQHEQKRQANKHTPPRE